MKKIITLALALVMALAIAAPALALHPGQAPVVDDLSDKFSISVALYADEVDSGWKTTKLTLPATVPANAGWVTGMLLNYGVVVSALDNIATEDENDDELNGAGFKLEIVGLKNLRDLDVYNYVKNTGWNKEATGWELEENLDVEGQYVLKTAGKNAANAALKAMAKGDKLVLGGSGIVKSAGSVKATIGLSSMATGTSYATTSSKITVEKTESYVYTVTYSDGADIVVVFTLNNKGMCKTITLGGEQIAKIYLDQKLQWVFLTGTDSGEALDGSNLKAIDAIFSLLGFDYSLIGTNAVYESNFRDVIDVQSVTASASWTLYATSIVVPDEVVEIPKTGDAASIMGFVMIAMALAAAAAVTYRKVRA